MKVKRALNKFFSSGFTLVELLIVIAILGILAAGIVVVINPMEKINSVNLAKAKTFAAGVENSLVMSQVGKWSFEEESGNAKDTSGNGNDGTLYGATQIDSVECGLELGGCLKFDGTDDYVMSVSSIPISGLQDRTIEFWAKPSKTDWLSEGYTVFLGTCNNNALWSMIASGSTGTWQLYDGIARHNSGKAVTTNWQHVAVTFTGTDRKAKIYVNGIQYGGDIIIEDSHDLVSERMVIGGCGWNAPNSRPFSGFIDEVSIYSKGLLSYQIQQLYAQGLVKHLLALK